MQSNQNLGKIGEEYAKEYLRSKGFNILGQNIRLPWGDEIDIIARERDKTLVFVEVKTVSVGYIRAEDQMTGAKQKKFLRASTWYLNAHPELVDEKRGARQDLIALTRQGDEFIVKHYENV